MSSNSHGLNVTKPVSVWNRSIKFDFKDFFKSLSKARLMENTNSALSIKNATILFAF